MKEKEPPAIPATKAEPRKKLNSDPVTVFQNLLGPSKDSRRVAYQALGWSKEAIDEALPADDARLYAVNLDADAELEYVLIVSAGPATTVAYVFDQDSQGWWQVGMFDYWWHWNADQAERLIELREIVWYGRKDIVVREQNGGTGVAETDLSIYRIYQRATLPNISNR